MIGRLRSRFLRFGYRRWRWLSSCGVFVLVSALISPVETIAQQSFDAGRAFEYLLAQCDFGPRPPGSIAHSQTRDYLISELKKFAVEVVAQDFTQEASDNTLQLTNIIATFGATEPKKKVLLAAHWDTRPIADHDPDPDKRHLPILGANDGASGVAILLELARAFHSEPPDIQVIMVLFDGEDYGRNSNDMFFGSRYFAKNVDDKLRPDYGVLIDMVGDSDLDIYVEPFSKKAAPDIVEKVWKIAKKLKLRAFHKRQGQAVMDDHVPLIQAGIKCIDIIDFKYPYWHTLEDTPDKCSPDSLEAVGRLLLELIYSE